MEEPQPSPDGIAAIYARVSTDNQRTQGTIASQVDELRELAAARGFAVGSELVFCDERISGATLVRPALERLRDSAAQGSFEVAKARKVIEVQGNVSALLGELLEPRGATEHGSTER